MFGKLHYFGETFKKSKVQNVYDNHKIVIFPMVKMILQAKCEYKTAKEYYWLH